jgi:hypothetical protein
MSPLYNPPGASSADLTTHESDTSTHGIADTSVLVTDSDLPIVTANRQTDDYILALTDAGKAVEMNKGTAVNLTVPQNTSIAFPTDTCVEIFQYGAGQVTVVADTNVTIRSSGGKLKLTGQYSGASLRKIATNEWVLVGDIAS